MKHRLIKGARYKSVQMATMFREDGGDLLISFDGPGPMWDAMLPLGSSIYMVDLDKIDVTIDVTTVLEQLVPMVVTHDSFDLYVYGLRVEQQVQMVLDWVRQYPTVRLTITQQTDGEIEVLEV